jgi:hypothetical protein
MTPVACLSDIDFTRAGLEAAGFGGFHHLYERRQGRFARIPKSSGVYVVLRESPFPVEFFEDRTVPRDELTTRWVSESPLVYVGRAKNLRSRLSRLAVKGVESVTNWGGRIIWQIRDTESMTVAWLATPTRRDAARLRGRFLNRFHAQHGGRPPFANKRRSQVAQA